MAIKKIQIRPEGTNDYADVLHPETSADMVLDTATKVIMTKAERDKLANLTKADVGLGNVLNYGVATQEEAKVGTSNTKYMTPLRTKEAIDLGGVVTGVGTGFANKRYTIHVDSDGLYLKEV